MRNGQELERAMEQHGDAVLRLCFVYMKNRPDAEDMFQNVFCRFLQEEQEFATPEHERAWLLRVAANACKDALRDVFRKRVLPLSEESESFAAADPDCLELRDAILKLPLKYRAVIYLHYIEGYSGVELSQMLGKKENTIYSLLSRGRSLLRKEWEGDWKDEAGV